MPETLLRTKLFVPPLRPDLVPRSQLVEKLNQGLQLRHKLTLISAPPGFGKTTLVSSWVQQLRLPAAWLSLDEGDNETARFFTYVIAALQQLQGEVGAAAAGLLESPGTPTPETLMTLLINDLAELESPTILVIDDYHVIQNLDIHKAITFLLENQPPQFHLILISREDPALPLHRLRGGGEMTGVHTKDLRFTIGEASHFLNETMGLSLSQNEVAALEGKTEGWVVALQLAAISMLDLADASGFVASFAGDDRYITDFLIGEVVGRQSPQVQEFLVKTALVDRFCASLGDALTKGVDEDSGHAGSVAGQSSQEIIQYLDQRNLFIVSLDNKRQWYRYHHLFKEFLRLRLQERPADEIAELDHRAAAWFAGHDFPGEAIRHFLLARDFVLAADLIERMGIRLVVLGQLRKMLDWLAGLPEAFIHTRPLLCVCQAWILNVTGKAAAAEALLSKAEQALDVTESTQDRHIRGLISMVRAYQDRRQGYLLQSIEYLRLASENISPDDLLVRSSVYLNLGFNNLIMGRLAEAERALQVARTVSQEAGAVYINLIAMAVQGNCLVARGRLSMATVLFEEAIAYGLSQNNNRPFPQAGYAYAGLGQVLYERNQLEEAERLLIRAVEMGESIADWSMVRRGLLPLAWLRLAMGDSTGAQKLWQQAFDVVRRAVSGRVEAQLKAQWARLRLQQTAADGAALAAAVDWADEYQRCQPDAISYQETLPQMILAQVELAQGKVDQAIDRLKRLAEMATDAGHQDSLIKTRALQAIAYDARGDRETALQRVDEVLSLAAPEGYIRTFVDLGFPMQHLLGAAAAHGLASDYVASLLSAFPSALSNDEPPSRGTGLLDHDLLVEPLSDKELSMLRLMAAGRSNREIGDALFLSVNTIKVYATRLYRKLGVNRRGEAVARAQELGLL